MEVKLASKQRITVGQRFMNPYQVGHPERKYSEFSDNCYIVNIISNVTFQGGCNINLSTLKVFSQTRYLIHYQ